MAHVLALIRQSTCGLAQFWQLVFGSRHQPNLAVQEQLLEAYSSGQPKMWPVSWVKTRSMLSGPQPSLSYCMISFGFSAYAKWASGYLVKKATYAQRVARSRRIFSACCLAPRM